MLYFLSFISFDNCYISRNIASSHLSQSAQVIFCLLPFLLGTENLQISFAFLQLAIKAKIVHQLD